VAMGAGARAGLEVALAVVMGSDTVIGKWHVNGGWAGLRGHGSFYFVGPFVFLESVQNNYGRGKSVFSRVVEEGSSLFKILTNALLLPRPHWGRGLG
jgi:hypothetical protein